MSAIARFPDPRFALRAGDVPASHARRLNPRRQQALIACLTAGGLEQLRQYFVPPRALGACPIRADDDSRRADPGPRR